MIVKATREVHIYIYTYTYMYIVHIKIIGFAKRGNLHEVPLQHRSNLEMAASCQPW